MHIKKVTFENFKGIKKTELNFSRTSKANVVTLVGPNECGKTTILEALHTIKKDKENWAVLIGIDDKESALDWVPMGQKGDFTGIIQIVTETELTAEEIKNLAVAFKQKFSTEIFSDSLKSEVNFIRGASFKSGNFEKDIETWSPKTPLQVLEIKEELVAPPPAPQPPAEATADPAAAPAPLVPSPSKDVQKRITKSLRNLTADEQKFISSHLNDLLPKILYFPNLLSRFPEKIYLNPEENPNGDEKPVNIFFIKILQDLLVKCTHGKPVNIKEHIHQRLIDKKPGFEHQVRDLLDKMGNLVTQDIQQAWNEIFSERQQPKTVFLNYGIDQAPKESNTPDKYYIYFTIKDGPNSYPVQTRSLGFRWFFCFFLFTLYRAQSTNKSGLIYLFDEPASNLHPKAQKKLLSRMNKIAKDDAMVIFSTHSHHLIDPKYLEAAFVIRNLGVDLNKDADLQTSETEIRALPYRQFVNKYPSETTYFQPIWDALDYTPSEFEKFDNAVLIEGKTDFFYLKYFKDVIFADKYKDIQLMPGTGAGSLGSLISLYQGWGRAFILLLDGDTEGKKQKEKYTEEHYLSPEAAFTLADVKPAFDKFSGESLFDPADVAILLGLKPEDVKGKLSNLKKPLAGKILELISAEKKHKFSDATNKNFSDVLDFVRTQVQKSAENLKKAA